jgi:phytoene dehydrogenase-like protein
MAVDVVVIGSGVGGLSCAALLARYGLDVLVCESHTLPGGAAHGFERQGFHFDSGPSLYSGLSYSPSTNPLRHVLDAIGESPQWHTYNTWGCCLPEGTFDIAVGAESFGQTLAELRPPTALAEWQHLQQTMVPYGEAAIALPPAAVRADWGLPRSLLPLFGTTAAPQFSTGQTQRSL